MTPQEQAAAVANRTPKPLSEKQKRRAGLAGPLDPTELAKLERKFSKPERPKAEPVKSKDTNGWGR